MSRLALADGYDCRRQRKSIGLVEDRVHVLIVLHAFISYAHLDNDASSGGVGWVTAFHRDLDMGVSKLLGRAAKIWRDDQLTLGENFEAAIVAALEHSAVLVIVMSPTFVERHWFQKEFSSFSNAAELRGGIVLNDRSRCSTS